MCQLVIAFNIICILFALYYNRRYPFHPVFFFCLVWISITIFASMRLYGLFEVSERIWMYVLLGEIAFCVPFLFKPVSFCVGNHFKYNKNAVVGYNYQLLDAAIVLLLIMNTYELYGAILQYASGMDMAQVRAAYFGYGEMASNTALKTVLHSYITGPLELLIKPLILVDFFLGSKNKKRLLAMIYIVITNIFISGGRFEIAYLIVQFSVIYLYSIDELKKYFSLAFVKRNKRKIILISLIGIGFIVLIVKARGANDSLWETVYLSLEQSLPNCEYRILRFDGANVGYFYGLVSFRGILNPILFVLKQIGILPYPARYLLAGDYMNAQDYVQVGLKLWTNAYVTPLYYFYIDGGVLGIIIGMLFFGTFSKSVYKRFIERANLKDIVLYLLIINALIAMMHNYCLTADNNYVLAMIYSSFFLSSKYAKVYKEE